METEFWDKMETWTEEEEIRLAMCKNLFYLNLSIRQAA